MVPYDAECRDARRKAYCQLVAHPVDDVEPVQLIMQQKRQAAVVLLCVADDAGGSIHDSL